MSHTIRADRRQLFLLPPNVDDWIAAEHPVRFVRDLVDSLDLESLGLHEVPGEDGRPHYGPEMLLGIWLYGYMERIRSSRALERACLRDLAFIWLTGNHHPDHNTLWRFFSAQKAALRKLFKQTVRVAAKAGLIGFALHALDGTKIGVASSMSTALHRKTLDEHLKRLDLQVDQHIAQTEAAQQHEVAGYALPQEMRDPKVRKQAIVDALRRLDQEETNCLHPSEPQARQMKGRRGILLAYNAQALVDHDSDMIVAADVVQDAADNAQLIPMLAQTLETTGRVAEATVADAGYASGEQFDEAERRHLPVIVATTPEPSDAGEFHRNHFRYDADQDVFICPRDEKLAFLRVKQPSPGGKAYPTVLYRCAKLDCPVKDQCTTDKTGRTVRRSPYDDAFARQVAHRKDPGAQKLFALRKEIVEHIFGIAKWVDHFERFTVRGLVAAQTQWAMVCTAINLRKLYAFWRAGSLQLRHDPQ